MAPLPCVLYEEDSIEDRRSSYEAQNKADMDEYIKETANLRARYGQNATPRLAHEIQVMETKTRALQKYFDELEEHYQEMLKAAKALREEFEKDLMDACAWMDPKTLVSAFESGSLKFEIFRDERNIEILREAYNVHGTRYFPPNMIIEEIAEDIIRGRYKEPREGDL